MNSVIPVLPAVASVTWSMPRFTAAGTPWARPITRSRMFRAISSGSSWWIERSRRLIRVATSSLGRLQFSDENA